MLGTLVGLTLIAFVITWRTSPPSRSWSRLPVIARAASCSLLREAVASERLAGVAHAAEPRGCGPVRTRVRTLGPT